MVPDLLVVVLDHYNENLYKINHKHGKLILKTKNIYIEIYLSIYSSFYSFVYFLIAVL